MKKIVWSGFVLVAVFAAAILLGTTNKGKIVLVRLLANESTPPEARCSVS